MQQFDIEPNNYAPRVTFEPSGSLVIRGRSLMTDVIGFYDPLITWAKTIMQPSVHITIELDYFNTASAKKILELLKIIDSCDNVTEFIVYWAFERDDEDILEKGYLFKRSLKKAKFNFIELAGI